MVYAVPFINLNEHECYRIMIPEWRTGYEVEKKIALISF